MIIKDEYMYPYAMVVGEGVGERGRKGEREQERKRER